MYTYSDQPHIKTRTEVALKELQRFIPSREKQYLNDKTRLNGAIRKGFYKMTQYQSAVGVNMEKEELLRDVCFLAGGIIDEYYTNKEFSNVFYKVMLASCADIVELKTKKRFSDEFLSKLKKTYFIYCTGEPSGCFNSPAIYLMFKSHLRISE